jgi:hypothetical protein
MKFHLAAAGEVFTNIQADSAIPIYKNQNGWTSAIGGQSATFSHGCVEHVQREMASLSRAHAFNASPSSSGSN